MRVKVRYFTNLRELAGSAEEELEIEDNSTLANLIKDIASKYGKEAHDYLYHKGRKGKVDPSIYFLINGVNARNIYGVNTKLRDGDIVAIIPPIGGGQFTGIVSNYENDYISFVALHLAHTSPEIDS